VAWFVRARRPRLTALHPGAMIVAAAGSSFGGLPGHGSGAALHAAVPGVRGVRFPPELCPEPHSGRMALA
jgi:hypothetical protein